jgi:hypothetical protein
VTDRDAQQVMWDKMIADQLAKGNCPYSGLTGPECKRSMCDCFEFEDRWGPSRR